VLGAVTFYPPHSGVSYPTEVEHQDLLRSGPRFASWECTPRHGAAASEQC